MSLRCIQFPVINFTSIKGKNKQTKNTDLKINGNKCKFLTGESYL